MTPGKTVAPYGSWRSPLFPELLASGSLRLGEPIVSGAEVFWLEGRAAEAGRQVVVRAALDGSGRADAIPAGFNARTRVHEYGGGAYTVADGVVFFSHDDDGRVYRAEPGREPVPISPEPPEPRALRYADFEVTRDGRTIHCVRESHVGGGEPVNEIVAIAAAGGAEPEVVATGHDFYAAPRLAPDGRLAYLRWDHPRMPWDGTELCVGDEPIAGGPSEAIVAPAWGPDGALYWVSDRTDWWNLYRDGEPLHEAEAEFGAPLWVFGQQPFAFMDDGRVACVWSRDTFAHIGLLDPESRELLELAPDYGPALRTPRVVTDGRRLAYVGASPTRADAVVVLDPLSGEQTVIARSTESEPNAHYVSVPEPIDFESAGGRTSHALFYPPHNEDFEAPDGELPPLLVLSHGGPTARVGPDLDLGIQFWTSRGFAVVDVNYGGSTGYGRPYRELLRGQWGVVDLEDCTQAALQLAERGAVDPNRLAIAGGSAGGYTTLCALAFTDVFHAGASFAGVADIAALFGNTHKFESHYDDSLVPPEKRAERSPINAADDITAPVAIFQGLEDPVVPPAQAEAIVAALERNGVAHEYHTFEGEAHGLRKAESIVRSTEAELAFYGKVFGFTPASG